MALRLDATTDLIIRSSNNPTVTSFSVLGWFKISVDRNDESTFIAVGVTTTRYSLGTSATGTNVEMYNNSTVAAGSALTVGTWFHAALTCAGTGAGQLLGYINGVQDTVLAGHGSVANTNLWIANNAAPTPEFLNGCTAAIKVYSAVLTAAEIAREMRYYRPIRGANLNSWMPCVHPTAASNGADFSGNGFNFTISGAPVVEDGPPIAWAPRHRMRPWASAVPGGVSIGSMQLTGVGL